MKIKNRYLIIIISALIVSGCQKPDFSEEERYIVKVLFLTADSFMEYAGEAFMAKHSNVLIDVIPFPLYVNIDRFEEELDRVIEETNPDILYYWFNTGKSEKKNRTRCVDGFESSACER